MSASDEEFEKKLFATFQVEADEHIRAMSSRLVELEKGSTEERASLLETIFREAHSLKGAARAVNASEVESICQSLESVFSALKCKGLAFSAGLFDVLHSCVDTIGTIVLSTKSDRKTQNSQNSRVAELIRALEDILKATKAGSKETGKPPAPTSTATLGPEEKAEATVSPVIADPAPAEVVRVSTAKLNSLLLQVEELRAPKMALGQHLAELRELGGKLVTWTQEKAAVRLELRALRETFDRQGKSQKADDAEGSRQKAISHITRLSSLLERNSGIADALKGNFGALLRLSEQDHRSLAAMTASLLEDARKLSLVPFSSLLEGFPKLVRDLCRDRDKDAELVIAGGEIETDRRILEEIKDPLIHLLRNCIDHGIETPIERQGKGKAPKGTITVSITPKDGDKVEVLLSDDGSGIDIAKIRSAVAAASSGPAEQIASLSDEDVLPLIFQSGVSTSPIITSLSGRGLGLAIAREKVEKLGGTLTVETRYSAGTTFRIVLPLTLATFRGVLVRSGEMHFIIPTTYVERVSRVNRRDIKTVENRETIRYGGETLSLARFRDILELSGATGDPAEQLHVFILRAAGERVAFQVDEILSEQEVLAKPFGQQLSRVRNLAGATILGTGKTVPIVNVHDLIKSAVKSGGAAASATPPMQAARKSILIAEDSITARTLLKNIVESAGYEVKTAVDGLDAYTALKAGDFDLVVSDVEMPRMTGFDLTAKIRADQKLSETPVVLVTALDSREDRERGIDVGANAYIVKSSFDHGNLLQVIQRLI